MFRKFKETISDRETQGKKTLSIYVTLMDAAAPEKDIILTVSSDYVLDQFQ